MGESPGVGELGRNMSAFRAEVRDDFTQVLKRLDDLLPREVFTGLYGALVERVTRLEEEQTALRRGNRVAILAGVTTLVTGVVLQLMKGHGT